LWKPSAFTEFVLRLSKKGYTPAEIAIFWGGYGRRNKVYEVLKRYNIKPNNVSLSKVCSAKCLGNKMFYRRRYSSKFQFCPFCGERLKTSKAYKKLIDAYGDLINE